MVIKYTLLYATNLSKSQKHSQAAVKHVNYSQNKDEDVELMNALRRKER